MKMEIESTNTQPKNNESSIQEAKKEEDSSSSTERKYGSVQVFLQDSEKKTRSEEGNHLSIQE